MPRTISIVSSTGANTRRAVSPGSVEIRYFYAAGPYTDGQSTSALDTYITTHPSAFNTSDWAGENTTWWGAVDRGYSGSGFTPSTRFFIQRVTTTATTITFIVSDWAFYVRCNITTGPGSMLITDAEVRFRINPGGQDQIIKNGQQLGLFNPYQRTGGIFSAYVYPNSLSMPGAVISGTLTESESGGVITINATATTAYSQRRFYITRAPYFAGDVYIAYSSAKLSNGSSWWMTDSAFGSLTISSFGIHSDSNVEAYITGVSKSGDNVTITVAPRFIDATVRIAQDSNSNGYVNIAAVRVSRGAQTNIAHNQIISYDLLSTGSWSISAGDDLSYLTITSQGLNGTYIDIVVFNRHFFISFTFVESPPTIPIPLAQLTITQNGATLGPFNSLSFTQNQKVDMASYHSTTVNYRSIFETQLTGKSWSVVLNGQSKTNLSVLYLSATVAKVSDGYQATVPFRLIPILNIEFAGFLKNSIIQPESVINMLDLDGTAVQWGTECWSTQYDIRIRVLGEDFPQTDGNVFIDYSIHGNAPYVVDDRRYLISPGYTGPAIIAPGNTVDMRLNVIKRVLTPNTVTNVRIRMVAKGFPAVYKELVVPINFIEPIDASNLKVVSSGYKNILTTVLNTNTFPDTTMDYIAHFTYLTDTRIPAADIRLSVTAAQNTLSKTLNVNNPYSLPYGPFTGYNLRFKENFGSAIPDIGIANITLRSKLGWTSPKSQYTYSSEESVMTLLAMPTRHPDIINVNDQYITNPSYKQFSFVVSSQQGILNAIQNPSFNIVSTFVNALSMSEEKNRMLSINNSSVNFIETIPPIFYQSHGNSLIHIRAEYILQDIFYGYDGIIVAPEMRALKFNINNLLVIYLNYNIDIIKFDISDIIYGTIFLQAARQSEYLEKSNVELWIDKIPSNETVVYNLFKDEPLNISKSIPYQVMLLKNNTSYRFYVRIIGTHAFGVEILQANSAYKSAEMTMAGNVHTLQLMCFFDISRLGYVIWGTALALFGPYNKVRVACHIQDFNGNTLGKFELPNAITFGAINNIHDKIEFFNFLSATTFPAELDFTNTCTVTVSYIYEN